jgi:hypothetical protein
MFRQLAAAFIAALALATTARAASVLPLYLDEIVTHAAVAFQGTCLENTVERDAATGYVVTYTTFAVSEVLKGPVGATYRIKQVGGDLNDGRPVFTIQGVPRFAPGQEYVLFLAGVSSLGFSSPVGLWQGRFGIQRRGGVANVVSGRDFRDLTSNVPDDHVPASVLSRLRQSPSPVRELGLEDFKQLVRGRGRGGP